MLCAHCGKREAEILIKQITGQTLHTCALCRECAEELGLIPSDGPSITISFSVSENDVARIKKKKMTSKQKKEAQENSLVCPECGTSYAKFREIGTLGCEKCYEAFRVPLGEYLQEHQGAESHWCAMSSGFSDIPVSEVEVPGEVRLDCLRLDGDDREKLERSMREAVDLEDYERAAVIRDKLSSLDLSDRTDAGCDHEHKC